jgi:hypothetical protein
LKSNILPSSFPHSSHLVVHHEQTLPAVMKLMMQTMPIALITERSVNPVAMPLSSMIALDAIDPGASFVVIATERHLQLFSQVYQPTTAVKSVKRKTSTIINLRAPYSRNAKHC